MKKALSIFLLVVYLCILDALPPSRESLESVAGEFVKIVLPGSGILRLQASQSKSVANEPLYFTAHLSPRGFVIIANELAALPVVAWSQEADFGETGLPDNLEWFIDGLTQQLMELSELRPSYLHPDWEMAMQGDFGRYQSARSVSPLLQTTWNQNYPYNASCPADGSGPGGRTYAGCVATAMAQICKYWAYPAAGSGTYSYSTSYGTLSVDFANSSFDYAAMPNSISSPNAAVADLIYKCGVASHMIYSATGSYATGVNALHGAIANFGYSPLANSYYKANYALATWNSMLQNELNAGHPIGYSGGTGYGAHAFVMDGFQATDYYHINWGWGGAGNGYFYLNNLSPFTGYDFTANQAAILGIVPAVNKPASCQATAVSETAEITWTPSPVTDFHADWKAWGGSRVSAEFGFTGSLTYETAIRFPVSSLAAYQGRQLERVRFTPGEINCSYFLKVYAGGSSSAPGSVVRTQAITSFIPDTWNTVELSSPYPISGTEEIWIAIVVTQTADGYPVGLDYGPRVQDCGNKIKVGEGTWTSLYALNSSLDKNWTIIAGFDPAVERDANRSLAGYKLWRFPAALQDQPELWTQVNPALISGLSYSDADWGSLEPGTWYWAIQAVHTQEIESNARLSNPLQKLSAPGSLLISHTEVNNMLHLNWQAVSGATAYRIYRSENPYSGFSLLGSTSGTSWSGLCPSTPDRYFYKVVAVSP